MSKVEVKMNEETVQYYITILEDLCKKLQQENQQLKDTLLEVQKIMKKTVFPNKDGKMESTVPLPSRYVNNALEILEKVGDK